MFLPKRGNDLCRLIRQIGTKWALVVGTALNLEPAGKRPEELKLCK